MRRILALGMYLALGCLTALPAIAQYDDVQIDEGGGGDSADERALWQPALGIELGVSVPGGALRDYAEKGVTISPYGVWNFNKWIGLQANLEFDGWENKDRPMILDSDMTWIAGALAGPRVGLPLEPAELYLLGQFGFFTNLNASDAAVTDSSIAWSVGGGVDFPLTDQVFLGGFGKYNRLYQRVHGEGDVRYVNAGVTLTYNFNAKPAVVAATTTTTAAVVEEAAPEPAPVAKKKIVLRGVNFDFDKSDIRADARPVLDAAIATLKENGDIAIVCDGHTDSKGSDEYNQKLSMRRSNSVRDYLVAGGISASRLSTNGFGESKPVATNETDDGRAQNRRVELNVSGQ